MELMKVIEIEKIHHHDKNPRRDVGDVEELADSIKKNGIMQNLTVVPDSEMYKAYKEAFEDNKTDELKELCEKYSDMDGYTLLIGHRRYTAAKIAGLKELPCKVVDSLSLKEQVGIMMEENMQRNDLTIMEQAEGFQYMLDLGDTPEQISEKTGFSQATVYHRLNIAKLDKDAVSRVTKEDGAFQLTLKDLYQLEQIKDIEKRNELLNKASSSDNLKYMINNELIGEKIDANREKFEKKLEEMGIERLPEEMRYDYWNKGYRVERNIYIDEKKFEMPRLNDEQKIGYIAPQSRYSSYMILVYEEKKEEEEKKQSKEEIRSKKIQEQRKQIEEMTKQITNEFEDIVMDVCMNKVEFIKKQKEILIAIWNFVEENKTLRFDMDDIYGFISENLVGTYFDDIPEDAEDEDEILEKYSKKISLVGKLLICVNEEYFSSICNYGYQVENLYNKENAKQYRALIKIMELFGYRPSEDIKMLVAGEHPLYEIPELEE